MLDALFVIVGAALVNNFLLTKFLGLCPLFGVSNRIDLALGMSAATAFVLTLSAVLSHWIETLVLIPAQAEYLRTVAFILVVASVVQITEIVISGVSPLLHRLLGLYLPLITTNCAVLGVALLNVQTDRSALHSALFGLGAAMGFSLVLVLLAAARETLARRDVPSAFAGVPIALVTASLMSLAFMGFAGLER
ncbi:MAG: electron transport complex subunit RsxA [Pseudomonadota bacterium]